MRKTSRPVVAPGVINETMYFLIATIKFFHRSLRRMVRRTFLSFLFFAILACSRLYFILGGKLWLHLASICWPVVSHDRYYSFSTSFIVSKNQCRIFLSFECFPFFATAFCSPFNDVQFQEDGYTAVFFPIKSSPILGIGTILTLCYLKASIHVRIDF